MGRHETAKTERAGRVRDARGQPVMLLDPFALNLLRRYDVIPSDALASISDEIGFGLPRWQRRGYVACVLAFLSCVAFLIVWKVWRRSGVDIVEFVLWPTTLAVFAVSGVKFWQSARNARIKCVSAVLLKHLRCPHCGYDIRGLPADAEDGATVCPECGCAWILSADDSAGGRADD
jgi:hypothetical protein